MICNTKEELTNWMYNAPLGTKCPVCGAKDPYNGTGPENSKLARNILRAIWWDKVIQKAVKVHDRRFHVGNHILNLSFVASNKEFRINVKKAIDAYIAKKWYRRWFLKYFYNMIDNIYYYAVSGKSGRSSYDKNSCLVAGGYRK